jgi:hypothetical protein
VTPFNAELYLRLCAEQSLLSGEQHHPRHNPLMERARALVAVGAITPQLVDTVLAQYTDAARLRGMHWSHGALRTRPTASAAAGPAPRMAGCHQRIETSWATVTLRYASFQNGGVRLAAKVTFPANATPRRRSPGGMHAHHPGPQGLTVTDDTGASTSAGFNGGGSAEVWSGSFEVGSGVSATTRWLDVEGVRVELDDAPDSRVAIERLDHSDPVRAYLERCLERVSGPGMMQDSLGVVTETLVASGAISADSPELIEVQTIADALQSARHGQPAAGTGLNEPWRSILSGQRHGRGRTGVVFIGCVTPAFDGIRAAVGALESGADDFELDIGLVRLTEGEDSDSWHGEGPVTYRAVDDRGNHYLGGLNGWSSDGRGLQGTVQFHPPLDPKAIGLDILLAAETERAVVGVDLLWDQGP